MWITDYYWKLGYWKFYYWLQKVDSYQSAIIYSQGIIKMI